jgi:hypothetical protein
MHLIFITSFKEPLNVVSKASLSITHASHRVTLAPLSMSSSTISTSGFNPRGVAEGMADNPSYPPSFRERATVWYEGMSRLLQYLQEAILAPGLRRKRNRGRREGKDQILSLILANPWFLLQIGRVPGVSLASRAVHGATTSPTRRSMGAIQPYTVLAIG